MLVLLVCGEEEYDSFSPVTCSSNAARARFLFASMRRSQQGMDSIAALEKAIQLELPLFSLLLSCALQI